jgi:hypothetical protein
VDWDKKLAPMTMGQLEAKRREFWATRVDGRKEVWQAIKYAHSCEGDEKTAQAILRSAGITPYDMDKQDACFCFDEFGARYNIPRYVLYKPRNIVQVSPAQEAKLNAQEAKEGKMPINFKIRLSEEKEDDLDVTIPGGFLIGNLKAMIAKECKYVVSRQHVFYEGRQLDDSWSLIKCRIKAGHYVQIFIDPILNNSNT